MGNRGRSTLTHKQAKTLLQNVYTLGIRLTKQNLSEQLKDTSDPAIRRMLNVIGEAEKPDCRSEREQQKRIVGSLLPEHLELPLEESDKQRTYRISQVAEALRLILQRRETALTATNLVESMLQGTDVSEAIHFLSKLNEEIHP